MLQACLKWKNRLNACAGMKWSHSSESPDMVPIALVFLATEPPTSYYMQPGGDIHIGRSYKMKMSKEQALAELKAKGYLIQIDTSQYHGGRADY
jgi:hypothetical protein